MGSWIYGETDVQANSAAGKALAELWPNVHAWIWHRKDKEGVSALPCKMQEEEATLWIDRLIPALESARIPVWTAHDCAIVPADMAEKTLEIVRALYDEMGMTVSLSAKPVVLDIPEINVVRKKKRKKK